MILFYNSKQSICRQPSWSAQNTDGMFHNQSGCPHCFPVCVPPSFALHLKHTHENFAVVELTTTHSFDPVWKSLTIFLPTIPQKGNAKECSNYRTIALISHASKVMLKILQARLQQYMNHELPDVQAGFRKGRGTRGQIANIRWIIEKAKEFQKNIHFCFINYAKAFDSVDHNKLWKILKEMGIPDHLICLLRGRSGSNSQNWT